MYPTVSLHRTVCTTSVCGSLGRPQGWPVRLDETENRAIGPLVGLAIGDALGAAVEFQSPGSLPPVTGYRAGGPHGLVAGEWTDDTSMALALADSIANVGWDLDDQARRYLDWWHSGVDSVNGTCFDIGITTARSLSRFETDGDTSTSGDPSERAAGNGSIMRLAPVPIWLAQRYSEGADLIVRRSVESSLPTHRAPQALSACGYLGSVLAALIAGEDRAEVLAPDWPGIDSVRSVIEVHPTIAEVIAGSYRDRQPSEIVGSGYVVRSLEAALWRSPMPTTSPMPRSQRSTSGTMPTPLARSADNLPAPTGAFRAFLRCWAGWPSVMRSRRPPGGWSTSRKKLANPAGSVTALPCRVQPPRSRKPLTPTA